MTEEEIRKIEYHEGYFCAGNGIPFDENQSENWKEGWSDGWNSLYGDDDYDIIKINDKCDKCHLDKKKY